VITQRLQKENGDGFVDLKCLLPVNLDDPTQMEERESLYDKEGRHYNKPDYSYKEIDAKKGEKMLEEVREKCFQT